MKITLNIPDDKAIFFLDLIKNLNFTIVNDQIELDIPDFHKKILNERMESYKKNPGEELDWDQVKKDLDKDNDL
jgi:hypothetical protein